MSAYLLSAYRVGHLGRAQKTDNRLTDDATNSIVAGALSGMIFKSTKGVKPMMISGGIVATAAGSWAVRSSKRDRNLHTVY